jgi:hypothetical protein
MHAAGAEPPGVTHLVILPGLDATGTQHAAFCAALREHGVTTFIRTLA